jgi:CheY-like chemotaxis protein
MTVARDIRPILFEPDLIITDIHMLGKNGLEMMKCIRTHHPMIQTIYMSADLSSGRAPLLEEEKKIRFAFLKNHFHLVS